MEEIAVRFTIYDLRFTIGTPGVESGAKATAVQTLREDWSNCAKRLECGAFTAALVLGVVTE